MFPLCEICKNDVQEVMKIDSDKQSIFICTISNCKQSYLTLADMQAHQKLRHDVQPPPNSPPKQNVEKQSPRGYNPSRGKRGFRGDRRNFQSRSPYGRGGRNFGGRGRGGNVRGRRGDNKRFSF
jgi:hypothetical protein